MSHFTVYLATVLPSTEDILPDQLAVDLLGAIDAVVGLAAHPLLGSGRSPRAAHEQTRDLLRVA